MKGIPYVETWHTPLSALVREQGPTFEEWGMSEGENGPRGQGEEDASGADSRYYYRQIRLGAVSGLGAAAGEGRLGCAGKEI